MDIILNQNTMNGHSNETYNNLIAHDQVSEDEYLEIFAPLYDIAQSYHAKVTLGVMFEKVIKDYIDSRSTDMIYGHADYKPLYWNEGYKQMAMQSLTRFIQVNLERFINTSQEQPVS
jgi:hypothetical protein